ncbi:MAG: hypothetical protein AB7I50_11320 [Vicinamibacterales bacterium]
MRSGVLAVMCATLLGCVVPVSAAVDRAPESSRYGVQSEVPNVGPLLIQARAAGFGWVHNILYWNFAQPSPCVDGNSDGIISVDSECAFDWSRSDEQIQTIADAGLNAYVRVAFAPTWSTGATYPNSTLFYCYDPVTDAPRNDDDANCNNTERRPGYRVEYTPSSYPVGYDRSTDFRRFIEAAVRRYKDRVRAWGFGTEVHSRVFWQGSPEQFFDEILRPGYETVKEIDPTLVVVGPDEDVLPEEPDEFTDVIPATILDELVGFETTKNVRAFDVISHHVLRHSGWTDWCLVNARLRPVVERVSKGRPVWLTELGFWSEGGPADDVAAAWVTAMLDGVSARTTLECAPGVVQNAWVDKAFVFALRDASATPDFGLFNSSNAPKPSFTAVQQFLAAQSTPRVYYLAEGATKSFFDLDVAIANPNDAVAPVKVSFLKPDGSVVVQTPTLSAKSRLTIKVDTIAGLASDDISTVVESTSGLPLAVERTMFWDGGKYGGHTDTAVQVPSTRWYFAEGSQGFFDTYVLLANSNIVSATATVTFLLQGAQPVQKTVELGPTSRAGFCTCQYAELANTSFGMLVEADQPIIAERSMYFGSNPFWTAGHESAGVTAPSTSWFMAEGRTGPVFDEWVLVSNPNDDDALVDVQFTTSGGVIVPYPGGPFVLAGKSRTSIPVEAVPGLEDVAVSTRITADVPVVAERAMYWPGSPVEWYEAHNSFGLTETGTRWALAEGRAGTGGAAGPNPDFETYILVYNTSNHTATVTVTYLLEGGSSFSLTRQMGPGRTDVVDWIGDARLTNKSFGSVIESDQPIVVERAMYWRGQPGRPWGWGGSNATAVKLQ